MENRDVNSLLERIAEDDHDAFRIFYDSHYLQVYRFASYFITSLQEIEEIVSDVFCAIWQRRKKLTNIEYFERYLYTITKNRAFYYHRRENNKIQVDFETLSETLTHNENPEHIAIDKELTLSLKAAIDALPERCRTIFLMAREEKLKYKEIAEILSISEKTVNAQMVLAIKKLSQRLGDIVLFLF